MDTCDRRQAIRHVFGGAAVTGLALAVTRYPIEAAPLATDKRLPTRTDNHVTEAQWGRPRRRRWVCWWSRGRRVCGWRWV